MAEKIEWYKEILELEPDSKLFFPLARLLKEEDRCNEAIDILEQGLERYPEFFEARLFLVELLYRMGRHTTYANQINKITTFFSDYTEFWQAWAACLSASDTSSDMPIIMRFMAAYFTRASISLHEVFDRGISAFFHPEPENLLSTNDFTEDSPPDLPLPQLSPDDRSPPEIVTITLTEEAAQDAPDEPDEAEERFSLRTRSMAEVLAEQGDFSGALDIYKELAAVATVTEEKADLLQRIATLNAKLTASTEIHVQQTSPEEENTLGKDKLISMLAVLAERVETRAHG